jgi:hypothetical protein
MPCINKSRVKTGVQSNKTITLLALWMLLGCNQKSGLSGILNPISNGSSSSTAIPTSSPTPLPSTSGQCSTSTGVASYFPCSIYFNQRVDAVTIAGSDLSYSNDIISKLAARGGWGNNNIMQIDFSIDVYQATANTLSFTVNTSDPNWYSTDSDLPPTIPSPPTGTATGFESSTGRTCDGGDCHYLVFDPINLLLTEIDGTNISGNTLGNEGYGSIAQWPFNKVWQANYRGDSCTSADAGGLMIAPMLFAANELQSGAINHAMRLILPNNRIANLTYVRPATHTTGGSGWAPAPVSGASDPFNNSGVPYGTRMRLKSSFSAPQGTSAGGLVVLKAMQQYGVILADGGNIALTAKKDAAAFIGSQDIKFLTVNDFEVIPPPSYVVAPPGATLNGNVITVNGLNCIRNP